MANYKNKYIINPYTGTPVFGVIPLIKNKSYCFPEGEIFLKYGEHRGANRGWGLKHIWKEHEKDMLIMGYKSESDVSRYIGDILKSGSKIYCEFSNLRNERVAVLQSSIGSAIIEHRVDGKNNTFYSVITAYKQGRRKPHGQLIGALK